MTYPRIYDEEEDSAVNPPTKIKKSTLSIICFEFYKSFFSFKTLFVTK